MFDIALHFSGNSCNFDLNKHCKPEWVKVDKKKKEVIEEQGTSNEEEGFVY